MRKSVGVGGFTLVEIMIVVGIIVVVAAISIPNFLTARERAKTKICITNLKQIRDAKTKWAVEYDKGNDDTPVWDDLVPGYIRGDVPRCTGGGTYTIGPISTEPTCSEPGHVL